MNDENIYPDYSDGVDAVTETNKSSEEDLLNGISITLKHLDEQLLLLNKMYKNLPSQIDSFSSNLMALNQLSENLPQKIHTDCLAEYKRIMENASKNYNQLFLAINARNKRLIDEYDKSFMLLKISSIISPILLTLLFIYEILH